MLPIVEFALNIAVRASIGFTPFYVNDLTHPRVPLTLSLRGIRLGGGEMADWLAYISPAIVHKYVSEFLSTRLNLLRHVRDALDVGKTKRRNKRMREADIVLNVKRLSTKFYSMLKPTYRCSVCRLQDKVASALHWTIYGRCEDGTCVYAQPPAHTAHTSSDLRWFT